MGEKNERTGKRPADPRGSRDPREIEAAVAEQMYVWPVSPHFACDPKLQKRSSQCVRVKHCTDCGREVLADVEHPCQDGCIGARDWYAADAATYYRQPPFHVCVFWAAVIFLVMLAILAGATKIAEVAAGWLLG